MSVNVHTEWDTLEEVIVGRIDNCQLPVDDVSFKTIEFPEMAHDAALPFRAYPDKVVEETAEDLEDLCACLTAMGVSVKRPDIVDHAKTFATPHWETDGLYNYCPRDVFLTIGNRIIETPMVVRARFFEPYAYRRLFLDYFARGADWLSAPKPELKESMYRPDAPSGERLLDLEPAFDAANVLRAGTDILYLVSDSGNMMGAKWLERTLGPKYKIHLCRDMYASTHIDSTLVLLRPGLLLANPARVNKDNLPDYLKNWKILNAPDMVDIGCETGLSRASTWIGMNLLSVAPDRVIVDKNQPELIKLLEANGVEAVPLRLRHARSLGGGFHCVTQDVRRRGALESY